MIPAVSGYSLVAAAAVALAAALCGAFWRYLQARVLPASPGTLPHLPNGHWLWGDRVAVQNSIKVGRRGYIWSHWLQDHGDNKILAMRMPGRLLVLLNDAETARKINMDHAAFSSTAMSIDAFGALAKGLFAFDGPVWYRHRRCIARSFSSEGQRGFFDAADACAGMLVRGLRDAATPAAAGGRVVRFECGVAFTSLSLDVMGEALLHCRFGSLPALLAAIKAGADSLQPEPPAAPAASAAAISIFTDMQNAVTGIGYLTVLPRALWRLTLPPGVLDGLYAASTRLRALAAAIVRAREAGPAVQLPAGGPYPAVRLLPQDAARLDFVSQMLAVLLEEEAAGIAHGPAATAASTVLSRAEIVEHVVVLMAAATETSAHSTSWAVWAALRFCAGAAAPASLEALTDVARVETGCCSAGDTGGDVGGCGAYENALAAGGSRVAPLLPPASSSSSVQPRADAAVPREETAAYTPRLLPVPRAAATACNSSAAATGDSTTTSCDGGGDGWPVLPIWERLYEEAARVVGPGLDSELRWEHLERLHYAEGVVKETLRLYSTVEATARCATADAVVLGHRVPAGTILMMNSVAMHTDPASFAHPLHFVPERWMPADSPSLLLHRRYGADGGAGADGSAGGDVEVELAPGLSAPLEGLRMRTQGAWNPFGTGPKMCIGHRVAVAQIKVVLVRLAQGFSRLRLAPGAPPVVPFNTLTTRPLHGLHVEAQLRGCA